MLRQAPKWDTFSPQVHRQLARPYTPHHRHPTAHNSAVERPYTWLYSTLTALLNATLINPCRAILCQPMLQRINPTTDRKSTCNNATKQCYSCFISLNTFLTNTKISLLKIQFGLQINVNITITQSLQEAHLITTQEQHGQLENYSIIISVLFYLIPTYLFNYLLCHIT